MLCSAEPSCCLQQHHCWGTPCASESLLQEHHEGASPPGPRARATVVSTGVTKRRALWINSEEMKAHAGPQTAPSDCPPQKKNQSPEQKPSLPHCRYQLCICWCSPLPRNHSASPLLGLSSKWKNNGWGEQMLLSKYTILARIKPHRSLKATPSRLSVASLLQNKRPSPGRGSPAVWEDTASSAGKAGMRQNLITTGSKPTMVWSTRPANAVVALLHSVWICTAIKAGEADLAYIHLLLAHTPPIYFLRQSNYPRYVCTENHWIIE